MICHRRRPWPIVSGDMERNGHEKNRYIVIKAVDGVVEQGRYEDFLDYFQNPYAKKCNQSPLVVGYVVDSSNLRSCAIIGIPFNCISKGQPGVGDKYQEPLDKKGYTVYE